MVAAAPCHPRAALYLARLLRRRAGRDLAMSHQAAAHWIASPGSGSGSPGSSPSPGAATDGDGVFWLLRAEHLEAWIDPAGVSPPPPFHAARRLSMLPDRPVRCAGLRVRVTA